MGDRIMALFGARAGMVNAVADALAPLPVEITELPITPNRLFRLIGAISETP